METDREIRERLALAASIKEELKKQEALKNSILQQLGQSNKFLRLAQHPALLVLLTFALTTVAGSWLTSTWQNQQRAYEQKYKVINETAQAIAELHAATTSVLAALQIENADLRKAELDRTVLKWKETRRDWLVNQAVLTGKIIANFPDEANDVTKEFDDIFYGYKLVNVEIGNMLEKLESTQEPPSPESLRTHLETINNETRDKTKNLISRLTAHLNE